MIQPACDPNMLPLDDPFTFGLSAGPFTVTRKCFLKKDLLTYSVDYTRQFFDAYADKRRYFSLRVIEGHEFTGELNDKVVDPEINGLLEYLMEKGHLKYTIVRMFSDHGDHINPLGYKTDSGRQERYNPFLWILIPKALKERMGKSLEVNTQRLLIAYDFFASDMELIGVKKEYKYGKDFYQDEIPASRTCADMFLYNADTECYCN